MPGGLPRVDEEGSLEKRRTKPPQRLETEEVRKAGEVGEVGELGPGGVVERGDEGEKS